MTNKLFWAGLGLTAFVQMTNALPFTSTNNDLVLGFRKTGVHTETHEAVVNIGQATTYLNVAPGSTIAVPGFNASQLVPDSFSSFNYLNWSVTGYSKTNSVAVLPGYVNNTLWLTVHRVSTNAPTTAPARLGYSTQGFIGGKMNSIRSGASYYSSQTASNQDNTAAFVREPVNDTANLTVYIASTVDAAGSTFNDYWTPDVEITTPASFSGSVVSDLYEVRPLTDAQGNPVTDPHTGQAGGNAYYVGFFQFNSNGTMTFTRATAGGSVPPAPILAVNRNGNTTTISFGTTVGATYTLYYTNAAGLSAPVSSWPTASTTVTGDGTPKQFTDTSADGSRFYRVGAH